MSRLLFLLPSDPTPLDAGARIRNYSLVKLLSAEHHVDTVVPEPTPRSYRRRVCDLLGSDLPDLAMRRWSLDFGTRLRCLLRKHDYAAVQAEGIEMAAYLAVVPLEQRVYDAHNAEFLLQRRLSESGALHRRLYSTLQWRRLERFERQVVRASHLTLAVSEHDANQLRALAGEGPTIRVIPNGIDAAAYPFRLPGAMTEQRSEVLFLGRLDFRPNAEALRWFVRRVVPAVADMRLFAVGADPPPWLIEAGQHDDHIAVTGYVDDERPYLARCAAMVLPVRAGSGSRLKALIGLASGLPIVSTRVGMEGLDAEPGVHFMLAETAAEWVSSLRQLLADPRLRQRVALSGRALVEQRYDWAAIRHDVRAAYDWLEP